MTGDVGLDSISHATNVFHGSIEQTRATIRPRGRSAANGCGKKESRNFLADDLHPPRENRTAKPLVCSFFRHVSSPCCQTTDSAATPSLLSLARSLAAARSFSSASLLEIFPSFS